MHARTHAHRKSSLNNAPDILLLVPYLTIVFVSSVLFYVNMTFIPLLQQPSITLKRL